jgi:hypothetical protein
VRQSDEGGEAVTTIDEIKARLAAATPGPWRPERTVMVDDFGEPEVTHGHVLVDHCPMHDGPAYVVQLCAPVNADFIAYAPTDMAFLLAEVERLRAVLPTVEEREAMSSIYLAAAEYVSRSARTTAAAERELACARGVLTRLDAYRAHEAAARFRARAGDEPGGAMVGGVGFCACGRRTPECDRSRKACLSREAE